MVRKADVDMRWDPFYFRPELVSLEKRVCRATSNRLRDFVVSMAGGATPSTQEAETHYTETNDGVPFMRVQNLSTTSRLNVDDCKRITRVTHEGLLRRSRLSGGELLVKITGVGRMAVASVVPDGFEGNINQHIVAIRTADRQTSETLAAYLNLDLAERLASRRATGGTRPALDYPALLSIPVIHDKRIPMMMSTAVDVFLARRAEASRLLATIDDILLAELGIPQKPEPPNTIESRMFRRVLSNVSGGRLDPIANQDKRWRQDGAIRESRFDAVPLRSLVTVEKELVKEISDGQRYLGLENISGDTGDYVETTEKDSVGTAAVFRAGQILFPKLRPYLNKTHLATGGGLCSTEFHVFTPHGIDGRYLTAFLRSRAIVGITSLLMTGNTLPRLQMSDIEKLPIPVPHGPVQERIADEVQRIKSDALRLLDQAAADLERAKREIEALILGKDAAKVFENVPAGEGYKT